MRVALCLSLAVLTVGLAAGCGSSSPTGPSAPDGPASGLSVLQGVLEALAGARAAAGTKVSVVGSELSTTVDSDGQFILAGLPSGKVTLRFEGEGVDAKVEVAGLVDGMVLTVILAVQGSSAHVLSASPPKASCDFGFFGVIESISGTRLQVSGRQVEAAEARKIWKGDYRVSLAELNIGDKVRVAGQLLGNGVIQAYEISADGPKLKGKP